MVQTPEGLLVFGGRGSSSELCIIREPGTAFVLVPVCVCMPDTYMRGVCVCVAVMV